MSEGKISQSLCVLGSTGSIGRQTLDIVRQHSERFRVVLLAGYSNVELLAEQCIEFQPKYVYLKDKVAYEKLKNKLSAQKKTQQIIVFNAEAELVALMESDLFDTVVAAIVGIAGLPTFFSALTHGKRVLLGNKESLVAAGSLFYQLMHQHPAAEVIPIDSEHNAIFQCLPSPSLHDYPLITEAMGVNKIILTASGGRFWHLPESELIHVTPEQACHHPNWNMGAKISVDSATMMNKALEIVEAKWLFGLNVPVEVLIHPQSMVHGLVQYKDGSLVVGMNAPDMKTHIANALAYPQRLSLPMSTSLTAIRGLEFYEADEKRFRPLALAREVIRIGGNLPIYFNACNEVLVNAFLSKNIHFTDIVNCIERILEQVIPEAIETLDEVFSHDEKARHMTKILLKQLG